MDRFVETLLSVCVWGGGGAGVDGRVAGMGEEVGTGASGPTKLRSEAKLSSGQQPSL